MELIQLERLTQKGPAQPALPSSLVLGLEGLWVLMLVQQILYLLSQLLSYSLLRHTFTAV